MVTFEGDEPCPLLSVMITWSKYALEQEHSNHPYFQMGGPSRYGASMRVKIAVSPEMRNELKSLQEGKTLLVAPFDTPPKDSSAKLPRCHASLDKAQLCDPHMQVVYAAECEALPDVTVCMAYGRHPWLLVL